MAGADGLGEEEVTPTGNSLYFTTLEREEWLVRRRRRNSLFRQQVAEAEAKALADYHRAASRRAAG